MQRLLVVLAVFLVAVALQPAWSFNGLVLPKVEFSATAIHDAGAYESRETIHYADGKLRIDRGNGFSSTILDFDTQTQCELMANHTYLVLPMDSEFYRRYVVQGTDMTGARKVGTQRIEGLETAKYAFGNDGALEAAGTYWLTKTNILIRREYEDGVYGKNVHHLEYLTHIVIDKQPASLFVVPAGYKSAK